MDNNVIRGLLVGYEPSEKIGKDARISYGKTFYSKRISGIGTARSASRLGRALQKAGRALYFIPCRIFGAFFLSLGLVTLLAHFAHYYFLKESADVFVPLVIGVLETILSVLLLISEKPLAIALQDGRLTEYLFFEFFCFKRVHRARAATRVSPFFAVVLGCALAALGYFITPQLLSAVLFGSLFLVLAFSSPEFPFFLTLLLLPFLPLLSHATAALVTLVLISALSFARKVFTGNRVFALEQYDLLILLFAGFYLLAGLFRGGSTSLMAMPGFVILLLGYTLSSNLITNRRLAHRAVGALLFSSAPISALAIYQYFFGLAENRWMDESFASLISGRVVSTFDNPNVLAVYLLAIAVIAFGFLIESEETVEKILYGICCILSVTALILTWSRGAWLALLITIPAYLCLRFFRRPGFLLSLIFLIPCALYLMPQALQLRLLSILDLTDSSIAYRLSIFRSSLSMLTDNLFLGIGIGADTFYEGFMPYAEEGVIAPHSHNLLLQIGCEAGIFALLTFVLLFFTRMRHLSVYSRYIRRGSMHTVTVFGTLALFALLIFGMTDYIWFAPPMYYLFFVLFGMGSASLRIAKSDADDRFNYHGDARRADASVIDITLS
ncbi:MAG: O-antigen ligase family protein [Clostridia bacterium]|nr:O-antigen ligase family protein [Clostridia bacterium]